MWFLKQLLTIVGSALHTYLFLVLAELNVFCIKHLTRINPVFLNAGLPASSSQLDLNVDTKLCRAKTDER